MPFLILARADYDFIEIFELEIVKGRNFSPKIDGTSNKFIINETMARRLGWDDPIGKHIGQPKRMGPVIGVVKDFHYANLHVPMEPVTIMLRPNEGYLMSIKINSGNIQETVAAVEKVWKTFSSGYPFDFTFMDESYDDMYKTEIRLGKSFRYYSILAILICCLGLFGLASFSIEQSTKEIGIRKVWGRLYPRLPGCFYGDSRNGL